MGKQENHIVLLIKAVGKRNKHGIWVKKGKIWLKQ